ncbi:hypothetical protein CK222_27525 [Mesorhizobium sp. WSM3866]|nr:hypothetical protein CK214_23270 [Mesorhizobium sp. WSM3882]PBB39664.1 hypothetical protein CK221_02290 [Mesorhizobium sp. WSM3868]PBB40595.1 hypothetical protein CK222_27525 [Mesorhizobium sp. WSM3866]PBB59123.1 hypothetical protein CK217_26230 [Mesorhizobium loti]PBB80158.1 hypothetical protein CK218_16170 [Mesorhizobium sp. WSM3879]PBB85138.1 hypothetical protein CK216_19885 [Mesorhizobium sp. WSM3876]
MVAEHVKLALFGPSLGYREGVHQPFGDRVAGAANKTGGSVLFDIRVDGDTCITAIMVMERSGGARAVRVPGARNG